jgi:hypothetical protein
MDTPIQQDGIVKKKQNSPRLERSTNRLFTSASKRGHCFHYLHALLFDDSQHSTQRELYRYPFIVYTSCRNTTHT